MTSMMREISSNLGVTLTTGGEPGCCNGFVQFRLRGVVQSDGEFFVGVRIHPRILPDCAGIDKCADAALLKWEETRRCGGRSREKD